MDVEIVVPAIVFGSMVLIFWIVFNMAAKRRAAELETVRSIVDKTGEVTPELIQAIGKPRKVKNADLRKGLILIAIAVAFWGLAVLIGQEEAMGPMMGVAMFPGLVGLVYVVFHFLGGNNDD